MATKGEMIKEEQVILDELIEEMDQELLNLDKCMTIKQIQFQKAKDKCLPDTYGDLIAAEVDKAFFRDRQKESRRSRDELYDTRLKLHVKDKNSEEDAEYKVGLHTFSRMGKIYILSWKSDACRRFILDDSATESDCVVDGDLTHFTLKMKRKVDMFFDKIKDVTQLYPLHEEEEEIIADAFLKELLSRRSEQEFRNIVFSIQKKQGEIIQLPFYQNLIVQGCAGSGKSMIMLHRLPILLFDNPKTLARNNLYIISPSLTYIQMANRMRIELEIEDLNMGTMEQYYIHVIEKYGYKEKDIGEVKTYLQVPAENERYIYSEEFRKDIREDVISCIEEGTIDCKPAYVILDIARQNLQDTTFMQTIRNRGIEIQKVLDENEKRLRESHRNMRRAVQKIAEFARMLSTRKIAVTRAIARGISAEEKNLLENHKELFVLDPEKNEKAYQNRINSMTASSDRLKMLRKLEKEAEKKDDYFQKLRKEAEALESILNMFRAVDAERETINDELLYAILSEKNHLYEEYHRIVKEIKEIGDPYSEYADSINSEIRKLTLIVDRIRSYNEAYLDLPYFRALSKKREHYAKLESTLTVELYHRYLLKYCLDEKNIKDKETVSCGPYMFLQIIYTIQGPPQRMAESLLTIDEAQNIAPEEIRLIKAVNGNKVILNLYGDIKQHVEGSKGIDSWKELTQYADFLIKPLEENYRNARQITDYCNSIFGMKMLPINLPGAGVHEVQDYSEFIKIMVSVFQKPQNPGLSCIIIKNTEEAYTILQVLDMFTNRIQDMTQGVSELQPYKWNIITVQQAKGLEFETVFAISGRMTNNEKYITYTRALDELYVYDELLPILIKPEEIHEEKKETDPIEKSSRKKRVKRSSKETTKTENDHVSNDSSQSVADFFVNSGVKVVDMRKKGGALWVVGEREEIEPVIEKAVEKFGISGGFSSGKATGFRPGWYTKTKK